MKKIGLLALSALMVTSLAGCGSAKDNVKKELKEVTLVLDYVPNTNHTGFYLSLIHIYLSCYGYADFVIFYAPLY